MEADSLRLQQSQKTLQVKVAYLKTLNGLPVKCAYSIKATSSAPLKAMPMSSPKVLRACTFSWVHNPESAMRRMVTTNEVHSLHVKQSCVTLVKGEALRKDAAVLRDP